MNRPERAEWHSDTLYPGDVSRLRTEVYLLRKEVKYLYWLIAVMILWLSAVTFAGDREVAAEDAAQFPQGSVGYLSTESASPESRPQLEAAMRMAVASMTRTVSLDQAMPYKLTETLFRLPLSELGWSEWDSVVESEYPYVAKTGLIVRADWFVTTLDHSGSEMYFRLLFGRDLQTLEQWFGALGVQVGSPESYGWLEEASQIAEAKIRLIQNRPTSGRLSVWSTYDSEKINFDSDPLEHLTGGLTYDASEHIALVPKSYAGTLGHIQLYALADSSGKLQRKAPAAIVTDYTRTRGVEIRNGLSCVVCHAEGLNPLSVSGLHAYIQTGAEIYAKQGQRADIERLYLIDLEKLIKRSNEDYQALILAICGIPAAEVSAAIKQVVQDYDHAVDMEKAARELETTVSMLKTTLQSVQLGGRLATLPSRPMPRAAFEDLYARITDALRSTSIDGTHRSYPE